MLVSCGHGRKVATRRSRFERDRLAGVEESREQIDRAEERWPEASRADARATRGLPAALWRHRPFVASLVRREFRLRSARAVWGSAWLVIEPAAQILIYTVIFGQVLGARLPGERDVMAYGIYVCAGIITWNYFADLVLRGRTLFLDHADLLRTVRFPRSTLPISMLLAATLNFAIVASLFVVALVLLGRFPGVVLLGMLPLLVVVALLGLGLAVLVGTLNVFFRDVGSVVSVLMQFWFWLTPIVYPLEIVPAVVRPLLMLNPMTAIMAGQQRIAVEGQWPELMAIWPALLLSLVTAGLGWAAFKALDADLLDEL